MNQAGPPVAVLVDWGTSHLRLWTVDANGAIGAGDRSPDGMGGTAPEAFAGILESRLSALGVPADVPVIMCGMVGARQGWQEAPYLDVPAALDAVIDAAVPIEGSARDVRILPGIADRSADTPDVMRGEETQLMGLLADAPDADPGLVCMPGTHAKWVQLDAGTRTLTGFATGLTGELFAALGSATVLRHSVGDAGAEPDHDMFARAVDASLKSPDTFLTRLFSIRPRSLLHAADAAAGAAYLSGAIIGQDIAGAIARFGTPGHVGLVGGGALGALYARALEQAGIEARPLDGEALVRTGLLAAARRIWPDRFATDGRAA